MLGSSATTQVRNGPTLTILVQPQKIGHRFRHTSERSNGKIYGNMCNADNEKKCYPKIKLENYVGKANILVSVATENDHNMHTNNLVVNQTIKTCHNLTLDKDNLLELPHIAINVMKGKKKTGTNEHNTLLEILMSDIIRKTYFLEVYNGSLKARNLSINEYMQNRVCFDEQLGKFVVYPENWNDNDIEMLRKQASRQLEKLNTNSCCLRFQAVLINNGKFTYLAPVFSDPIHNAKSTSGTKYQIISFETIKDENSGSAAGGDRISLMTHAIDKKDVEVVFFEEFGPDPWKDNAKINDVTIKNKIKITTPAYKDQNISKPVKICVQLRRKTDHANCSDVFYFTYLPVTEDDYHLIEKRKKYMGEDEHGLQPHMKRTRFQHVNNSVNCISSSDIYNSTSQCNSNTTDNFNSLTLMKEGDQYSITQQYLPPGNINSMFAFSNPKIDIRPEHFNYNIRTQFGGTSFQTAENQLELGYGSCNTSALHDILRPIIELSNLNQPAENDNAVNQPTGSENGQNQPIGSENLQYLIERDNLEEYYYSIEPGYFNPEELNKYL